MCEARCWSGWARRTVLLVTWHSNLNLTHATVETALHTGPTEAGAATGGRALLRWVMGLGYAGAAMLGGAGVG